MVFNELLLSLKAARSFIFKKILANVFATYRFQAFAIFICHLMHLLFELFSLPFRRLAHPWASFARAPVLPGVLGFFIQHFFV
jgi:hypothetical protein